MKMKNKLIEGGRVPRAPPPRSANVSAMYRQCVSLTETLMDRDLPGQRPPLPPLESILVFHVSVILSTKVTLDFSKLWSPKLLRVTEDDACIII